MMGLSGQQRKQLQSALIDAFPTTASLEQMLAHELDRNLKVIAGEGNLQEIVFKLINAAESQGWVEDLVRAAYSSNSGNQLLKVLVKKVLPSHDRENHRDSSPNASQENLPEIQVTKIKTKDKA